MITALRPASRLVGNLARRNKKQLLASLVASGKSASPSVPSFAAATNAVVAPSPFSSAAAPEWLHTDSDDGGLILQEIEEANDRYAGRLQVREAGTKGWGLFALERFEKGEFVLRGNALLVNDVQDKHSIQTGWDLHAQMDFPARLINHVCGDANVGVRLNETGAYDFYAMEVIHPETELLFDYETTEYHIEDFPCHCGSQHCRGSLQGFKSHGPDVLRHYETDFISPYLLEHHQQQQK